MLSQLILYYATVEHGDSCPGVVIMQLLKEERSIIVEDNGDIYIRDRETMKEIPVRLIGETPEQASHLLITKLMEDCKHEEARYLNRL